MEIAGPSLGPQGPSVVQRDPGEAGAGVDQGRAQKMARVAPLLNLDEAVTLRGEGAHHQGALMRAQLLEAVPEI